MIRTHALGVSLWTRLGVAAVLVVVGDYVVHDHWNGAACALLAAAAVAGLAATRPLTTRLGRVSLVVAVASALLLIERPSLLGWLFLFAGLTSLSLAPRVAQTEDALGLALRAAAALARSAFAPVQDLQLVQRARRRAGRGEAVTAVMILRLFGLPIAGALVFALLFAAANPVLGRLVALLRLPEPDLPRAALWIFLAVLSWFLLRPRIRPRFLRKLPPLAAAAGKSRMISASSVVLSLAVFNALFAVQNGLDLTYLWGGVRLPPGVSYAEYAHRGAYPLILTAILAGAFVLVFLRPGSEVAEQKTARWLVTAWVAQNVFLVISTALRTLAYIEAYSLTRLRIAALLWMLLVAIGLILICWRLLRGKSSGWLINANAAAAGLMLALCMVVDLGAVAAAWNVRHARELGTGSAPLDLCYLRELGPKAVVPLSELSRQPLPPALQVRIRNLRDRAMTDLAREQGDWRSWTWRGERRLARATAIAGPYAVVGRLLCDGSDAAAPLTAPTQPGS